MVCRVSGSVGPLGFFGEKGEESETRENRNIFGRNKKFMFRLFKKV